MQGWKLPLIENLDKNDQQYKKKYVHQIVEMQNCKIIIFTCCVSVCQYLSMYLCMYVSMKRANAFQATCPIYPIFE